MQSNRFCVLFFAFFLLQGCNIGASHDEDMDIVKVSYPCMSALLHVHLSGIYGYSFVDASLYAPDSEPLSSATSVLKSEYAGEPLGDLALSVCYLAQGNHDDGEAAFNDWLSDGGGDGYGVSPASQDIYFMEALVFLRLGLTDEALSSVGSALTYGDGDAMLWNFSGSLSLYANDWKAALDKYKKSLDVGLGCREPCAEGLECYCPEVEEAYLGAYVASKKLYASDVFCPGLKEAVERVNGSRILRSHYREECETR